MLKIVVGVKELRAPFFTATIVPVVLSATVAWNLLRVFNAAYFMLTLIAVTLFGKGHIDMLKNLVKTIKKENLELKIKIVKNMRLIVKI